MRRSLQFSGLQFRLFSFFFIKKRVLRLKRPKWRFLKKGLRPLVKQLKFCGTGIPRLKIRTRRGRLVYPFFHQLKQFAAYQHFHANKVAYFLKFPEQASSTLKLFFSQPVFLSRCCSRWSRKNALFRESVQMKRRFLFFYDFGYALSFFQKKVKLKAARYYKFNILFIKPEFRVDVLLWRLHFFSSLYAARHALLGGFIKKNFQALYKTSFIKSGDILMLEKTSYSYLKHTLRYLNFSLVPSFIEVDYYCNSLVCVMSNTAIKQEDCISIKRNMYTLSRLNSYLGIK